MTSGLPVVAGAGGRGARRARPVAPRAGGRARARTRPRRAASPLLIVTGLVGASALIGTPAFAQSLDCKEAPEPDRPGTGLVGSLDPADRSSAGEPGSVYNEVGYAGMVWHNYDLGCAGTAFNPASTTDTWLGNQAFNVAKFAVGGVNWAHYLISGGGDLLAPLDGVIRDATSAMYQAVFTTWIGPALVVLVGRSCWCSPSAATWPGRRSARRSRSPRSWSGRPPTSPRSTGPRPPTACCSTA